MIAGLSTLGVKLSFGVETSAGTKPTSFEVLHRVNSISGITFSTETIDASALEDYAERSVAGRQTSGGSWNVTFNFTQEVAQELSDMIDAYKSAKVDSKRTWFQIEHPALPKSFFVVAEPPQVLPLPSMDSNELLTIELGFSVDEYKGMDTKVTPTDSES